MSPRVFFVHPVNSSVNDISGAMEYGEPVFVNRDYVFADLIEQERIPENYDTNMKRAAADFDPECDLLAIVGDHLQLVALAGLIMQRHGRMRVLRWDRDQLGYLPVSLSGSALPA